MQKTTFLKLTTKSVVLGSILGTLAGVLAFFFYSLAYYGILGIVFYTISGTILGALNSVVITFVDRRAAIVRRVHRQRIRMIAVAVATSLGGIILYTLLHYPLARSVDGALIISLIPTALATLIAMYASQRAAHLSTALQNDPTAE